MSKTSVLFIQGGGAGAHLEDAPMARSLQRALGSEYDVHFPRMPNEADPNVDSWKRQIFAELSRLRGKVLLVAHSIGGSILLRYLSEERVERPIAGAYLLAAPSRDDERWNYEDLQLPRDLAEKLAPIPRVFFYHCRDDEIVPFAHLGLHASRLSRAVSRSFDRGGHQFGNDLTAIAQDMRATD